MRSRQIFAIAILGSAAVLAVTSGTIWAHHSVAQYTDKLATMDATIVEYRWVNPHVTIVWDSKDESGKVVRWRGELASVQTVMGAGLTKNSLKPGDAIRLSVYPSKLGTPESVIQYIERPDGTVVLGWSNQAGGNPEGRAQRQRNRPTQPTQ